MKTSRRLDLDRPIALDEFEGDTDPSSCRFLWCAVLRLQWDLAFPPFEWSARHEMKIARGWFRSNGFYTVCALAGVDPSGVLASFDAALREAEAKAVAA